MAVNVLIGEVLVDVLYLTKYVHWIWPLS